MPEARPPSAHTATCVCQGRLCLAPARQSLLSLPLLSLTQVSRAVLLQGIMQVGVLFTQVTTVTLMLAAVQALEVRPRLGCSQCGWGGSSAPAWVQLNQWLNNSFSAGGTLRSLVGGLPTVVAASWNHAAHQPLNLSWAHGPAGVGHGCIPSGSPASGSCMCNALSMVAEAGWASSSGAVTSQHSPAS